MSQGWKSPRNSGVFFNFFAGINFRGFNKTEYFTGTNFRDFGQKPRKTQKLIPAEIGNTKVATITLKNLENVRKRGKTTTKQHHTQHCKLLVSISWTHIIAVIAVKLKINHVILLYITYFIDTFSLKKLLNLKIHNPTKKKKLLN